jgi:hypothetical protein
MSVPLVGPEEVIYKLLGSRFNSRGNKSRKSEVSQPRWFLWKRSLALLKKDGSELAGHCFTCGGGAGHDCIVFYGPGWPVVDIWEDGWGCTDIVLWRCCWSWEEIREDEVMFNVRVRLVLIGLAEIWIPDQVRYLPTLSISAREKVSMYRGSTWETLPEMLE